MIQYNVYPGGVKRIVTFSFDDGPENDIRLISLFNKYGLKSTFHLNGRNYQKKSEEEIRQIQQIYANHEISCHTYTHGWPTKMPEASLVAEIVKDREILEEIAQYPVTGMSYPSGDYDKNVISIMKTCGIEYSRTVGSTQNFAMPSDFLEWNPTCHFKSAGPIVKTFVENLDSQWYGPLMYIWGHSHELHTDEDWQQIEKLMSVLANNSKIWYATNIEIYNYVKAQKMLKISYNEEMFYNPSALDVWVEKDKEQIIKIPAGEMVIL